jgi:hypothetical protein
MTAEKSRANRTATILGLILAAGGVIGLLVARDLAFLWAFMIAFGLAKLPEQAYRRWKSRRRI